MGKERKTAEPSWKSSGNDQLTEYGSKASAEMIPTRSEMSKGPFGCIVDWFGMMFAMENEHKRNSLQIDHFPFGEVMASRALSHCKDCSSQIQIGC